MSYLKLAIFLPIVAVAGLIIAAARVFAKNRIGKALVIAIALSVSATPVFAQANPIYQGYIGTVHILVGTGPDGTFGYEADQYGVPTTPDLPARLFSDRNVRPLQAIGFSRNGTDTTIDDDYFFLTAAPLNWETADAIPYPAAATATSSPPLWIRMQVRQGEDGEVIQSGNMWIGTSPCPANSICWKAEQPQPRPENDEIGNEGIATPADRTAWAIDFFDTEVEATNFTGNNIGDFSGYITFIAKVANNNQAPPDNVITLSCMDTDPLPCYIAGGYPAEMINSRLPYNGRLLSIEDAADKDTITLTTDAGTPFDKRPSERYGVTLVKRDGERIGLTADLRGQGVDNTSSPNTITIDLQPDSYAAAELEALSGQAVSLVFSNEGVARMVDRTPGPAPGLTAQLILGVVGGIVAFTIAGIGRYITPAREIIATAVVAASMSILPALNWGGSFWFVGGTVVLMLAATAGLMALKSRAAGG